MPRIQGVRLLRSVALRSSSTGPSPTTPTTPPATSIATSVIGSCLLRPASLSVTSMKGAGSWAPYAHSFHRADQVVPTARGDRQVTRHEGPWLAAIVAAGRVADYALINRSADTWFGASTEPRAAATRWNCLRIVAGSSYLVIDANYPRRCRRLATEWP